MPKRLSIFKADILNLGLPVFTFDVFEAAQMILKCCCIGRCDESYGHSWLTSSLVDMPTDARCSDEG